MNPTTYAEADLRLHRGDKPVQSRKVANNTYLQRRGDNIAVRLHQTDVVTFRPDGSLVLHSGGWVTNTTQARINDFTPAWIRLHSERGRWLLTHQRTSKTFGDGAPMKAPDYDTSVGFLDGVTLTPDPDRSYVWHVEGALDQEWRKRQDAHNAQMERLINRYLRGYTEQIHGAFYKEVSTPCGMCVRTDVGELAGDLMGDTQHLIDHLLDRTYIKSLSLVASDYARKGEGWNRFLHHQMNRNDLRQYLRARLYVGHVRTRNGRRIDHDLKGVAA